MPIKSYFCPACNATFERLMKRSEFDATDVTPCPECQTLSAYTISVPARRNPAHGIQR
jgi:putative FmdB family regulatory protein